MPKIWRKKKGDSIIYMLYLQVTKQLDHPAVWHHRAKTSGWFTELFIFIKIFCPPLDNIGASHLGVRGICTCLHMQRHLQWQTERMDSNAECKVILFPRLWLDISNHPWLFSICSPLTLRVRWKQNLGNQLPVAQGRCVAATACNPGLHALTLGRHQCW